MAHQNPSPSTVPTPVVVPKAGVGIFLLVIFSHVKGRQKTVPADYVGN